MWNGLLTARGKEGDGGWRSRVSKNAWWNVNRSVRTSTQQVFGGGTLMWFVEMLRIESIDSFQSSILRQADFF